jgi:hypothetical protein
MKYILEKAGYSEKENTCILFKADEGIRLSKREDE